MAASSPEPGSPVVILAGTFKGFEGTFEKWCPGSRHAQIVIVVFGHTHTIELAAEDFTTDIQGAWMREYEKWAAATRASLPLPHNEDHGAELARIAGSYHVAPLPSTNARRMKLDASGALELFKYSDLGGHWGLAFTGYYLVESGVMYSNVMDFRFSFTSFDQDGRLYIRQLPSIRALVPEEFVKDFDRLSLNTTLSEDSFQEALFHLRLFVQDTE